MRHWSIRSISWVEWWKLRVWKRLWLRCINNWKGRKSRLKWFRSSSSDMLTTILMVSMRWHELVKSRCLIAQKVTAKECSHSYWHRRMSIISRMKGISGKLKMGHRRMSFVMIRSTNFWSGWKTDCRRWKMILTTWWWSLLMDIRSGGKRISKCSTSPSNPKKSHEDSTKN